MNGKGLVPPFLTNNSEFMTNDPAPGVEVLYGQTRRGVLMMFDELSTGSSLSMIDRGSEPVDDDQVTALWDQAKDEVVR
jgi:hypothetical protein